MTVPPTTPPPFPQPGQALPGFPQDDPRRLEFALWAWEREASPEQRAHMERRLDGLRARGHVVGAGCAVSAFAVVDADTLELGDRSYVAAHAHVTGQVVLGADCSVNVGTAVRGRVRVGDCVRIGASTSLLGFNHGFDELDVPVFRQPLTSAGIDVGDDVWIGAHVVVLDGVTIGSHAVVGAGSVVTKDVPPWAIVVGNPARVVRDRREDRPTGPRDAATRLRSLGDAARAQVPGIVARAWTGDGFRDAPDREPTVRAHGDAVELTDLVGARPPEPLTQAEHVRLLRSWQDPATGLVPAFLGEVADDAPAGPFPTGTAAYHVLSTGYALALLGAGFAHPVRPVTALTGDELHGILDALPWRENAWGAGATVDAIGTALAWARLGGHAVAPDLEPALLRWLADARDPGTGLWGSCAGGLREPVNGTYRLVRGTFAQLGPRAGADDALVDTVLRRAGEVLDEPATTACDVLDVAHLLWWAEPAARDRRATDVTSHVRALLDVALGTWHDGRGATFQVGGAPGLQGTEMWLATTWYLADLLGLEHELGLRPRGVHRPEPLPVPEGPAS